MNQGNVTTRTSPLLSRAAQQADDGEYEAAAGSLIAHLRQVPEDPAAMAQLGFVAMRLGALRQSEHFLRRAIAAGTNSFEVRRNLAAVLAQQERPVEALPMLDALIHESGDIGLQSTRAGILDKLGRSEEAQVVQGELARANPTNPQMWIAYGHSLRAAGKVDAAIAAYRQAISGYDDLGDAWWGLASIKRPVLDDQDVAALRQSLTIAVDLRNIAPLHFALARALHDRGDFEGAFGHYHEGNRLRAESLKYDARELTEEIAEVERTATRDFMARFNDAPLGTSRPIFIVSLPRSGSTLLEQMLGCHPDIEPVGELPYVPAIMRSFMEMATRRGKITVPQAIARLTDEQAAVLGNDYLQRAAQHRKTDRPFFIDKLPHNWSNMLFIKRIIPQARFIDIRRPAMDCCFSNFTQSFTSAHAASFALRDVGQCYVDNVRLMDHFDRVMPGLVHHISYEALVENPREEVGRALDYLGLQWDDAILNFHQLGRVVRTPSSEQVRRPLNRDGMEVWKPYSPWLNPLREVLGVFADC